MFVLFRYYLAALEVMDRNEQSRKTKKEEETTDDGGDEGAMGMEG